MEGQEVFLDWLEDAEEALLGSLEGLAEAYLALRKAYLTVRPAEPGRALDLGEGVDWNGQAEELTLSLPYPPYKVLEASLGPGNVYLCMEGHSSVLLKAYRHFLHRPGDRKEAVEVLLAHLPREPRVLHGVVTFFEDLTRRFREGEAGLWAYGARMLEEQKEEAEALRERATARRLKGL